MSKSEVPPPAPPSYMQAQYNTPASYGVPGGNAPPPPPPMMTANPGVPPTTVTTVVMGTQRRIFSKHPTAIVCQHCNTSVVTCPRAEIGLTTWAIVGFMILLGLWLGCCLIPFCIDECKDIHHDCPNCHQTIDIYKHM